jgi:hypothetical protein
MTKPLFVDFDTFGHMKSLLGSHVFVSSSFWRHAMKDDMAMKELDLSSHGLPMTILAPDSAVVQEKDYNFMRDVCSCDHLYP